MIKKVLNHEKKITNIEKYFSNKFILHINVEFLQLIIKIIKKIINPNEETTLSFSVICKAFKNAVISKIFYKRNEYISVK